MEYDQKDFIDQPELFQSEIIFVLKAIFVLKEAALLIHELLVNIVKMMDYFNNREHVFQDLYVIHNQQLQFQLMEYRELNVELDITEQMDYYNKNVHQEHIMTKLEHQILMIEFYALLEKNDLLQHYFNQLLIVLQDSIEKLIQYLFKHNDLLEVCVF